MGTCRSSRPEVFCRNGILSNFAKFTGKYLCQSLYFNKVGPATLLKKRLWHRCVPVNFAKFLRTPFLKKTSGQLLLYMNNLGKFTLLFLQFYQSSSISYVEIVAHFFLSQIFVHYLTYLQKILVNANFFSSLKVLS